MESEQHGVRIRRIGKISVALLLIVAIPSFSYWMYHEVVGWLVRGPTPKELGLLGLFLILVSALIWSLTQLENSRGKTFLEDVILDE